MGQESTDRFDIFLNTTSDNFVKVISGHLAKTGIVIYPTKYIFMGKINESTFKLYRLKKFSRFDYNATEFKGTIHNNGQLTNLTVDFSLMWIYKNIIILTFVIFGLLDFFIIYIDNATWPTTGAFLFVELLVLGQLRFQNKSRFKKDKERYFEILKSLFGTVEIKNNKVIIDDGSV
jgi:hypothetical protein